MNTRASEIIRIVLVVSLAALAPVLVRAQEPQVAQVNAPPPLRTIPRAERSQLDQATDNKQRLRLTIEFAAAHLNLAEQFTTQQNFEAASAEVGFYQALIENALMTLASLKRDSNKTRDLYKRLELVLREDGPRLTAMRRTTPIEFAVWIKEVEDFAREGRTEALNSFYGHTVVRDQQGPGEPATVQRPKPEPTKTP